MTRLHQILRVLDRRWSVAGRHPRKLRVTLVGVISHGLLFLWDWAIVHAVLLVMGIKAHLLLLLARPLLRRQRGRLDVHSIISVCRQCLVQLRRVGKWRSISLQCWIVVGRVCRLHAYSISDRHVRILVMVVCNVVHFPAMLWWTIGEVRWRISVRTKLAPLRNWRTEAPGWCWTDAGGYRNTAHVTLRVNMETLLTAKVLAVLGECASAQVRRRG